MTANRVVSNVGNETKQPDEIVAVQIIEISREEFNTNPEKYSNAEKEQSILLQRPDSARFGCEVCKGYSTQKFIGYCGDVLWLCETCYDLIIKHDFLGLSFRKDRFGTTDIQKHCMHDWKEDEAFVDDTVLLEFDGQEETRFVCSKCGKVKFQQNKESSL